jgi:hypothetical protein
MIAFLVSRPEDHVDGRILSEIDQMPAFVRDDRPD